MKEDIRLCLSLYACEPHRGSEPGVGWAWALGMARRHKTWVITRANNRDVIETELDRLCIPAGDRPHFVWVDLPQWVLRLKKRGIVPVGLYYLLWQFAARRAWDKTGVRADVIHHVTFCSYVVPGVWWHRSEKVVLGPLGGTAVCPFPFLREYPLKRRVNEWFRGICRRLWFLDPFFVRSRRIAEVVLFVDRQSAVRMGGKSRSILTMLDVAVPDRLVHEKIPASGERKRQFVWAGTLAGHKAPRLALRAFAKAFSGDVDAPSFLMFGKGPDAGNLARLASKLGISDKVAFRGSVPQEELWREMSRSLGFVFTSVRDTCGSVSVEALACGTPLVCFHHQGVGEVVDESCGIPVQPGSYASAVSDFAAAMRRLADHPDLVERLGSAGRKRAIGSLTWNKKFDHVDSLYRDLLRDGTKPK